MCTDIHGRPDGAASSIHHPEDLEAAETIRLLPVDGLTVTTLVDNSSDLLLADQGPVKRTGLLYAASIPRLAAAVIEGGETFDVPLAEHGFAVLVSITRGGREHRILFDAGMTPDGLVGNMRRLGLAPGDVEAVVLSHGHSDHVTGLDGFIRTVRPRNLPIVVHPGAWARRRIAIPGVLEFELPSPSRRALAEAGFDIIESSQPSLLLDGSVLITGEVDRTTAFEQGMPFHEKAVDDGWEPDPLILDDQALILEVAGHGLVVLTGCGHAGIVNIVRHARHLTGVHQIAAVVGGFHLSGPAFEPIIAPTVQALADLGPEVILPAHCTGWRAAQALAARLPESYVPNSVGTRLELSSVLTASTGSGGS